MLQAHQLSKRFAPTSDALTDVSFEVADGELCVLVGHNGAGKTTCMNCFLDFVRPDRGHAAIDGMVVAKSPVEARRRVAFLGETVAAYPTLTGRENVRFFVRLAGRPRLSATEAGDALARLGMPSHAIDRPVATYSKGMRQRVGLAIAASCRVANLILDEPTTGLDPDAAAELVSQLGEMSRDGCAVLTSSHDLARLAAVASLVVCLARGRVVGVARGAEVRAQGLESWYDRVARSDVDRPEAA